MAITHTTHPTSARPATLVPIAGSQFWLGPASAGDHLTIRALLADAGREPSMAEFQSQIDEPYYEPTDRLVVRQGMKLLSHVRIQNRTIHFGRRTLPVAWLTDLATISEYRRRGFASALVAAAERQMQTNGAVLGLVNATHPGLFLRRGWIPWGRPSHARAGARDVLAQIVRRREDRPKVLESVGPAVRPLPSLSTRLWRHVEQSALERIYEANVANSYGPAARSSEYWRWLVSRHGHDAIYVAVAGRDRWTLDTSNIVGYAVVRNCHLVELFAAPERPDAIEHLMTRICGEFIEEDRNDVWLDAAPNHPWYAEMLAAGGELVRPDSEHGHTLMARLFQPLAFLGELAPELTSRVRGESEWIGAKLALRAGSLQATLVIHEGRVEVQLGADGESWLEGELGPMSQAILGHDAIPTLLADGRLHASDARSARLASLLFPKLPYWHPTWDDLPSQSSEV
ncbi:MAG: GNAT family N-acetyltransferase [Pirellulales bacterium]